MTILIKNQKEIAAMREGGKRLAEIMEELRSAATPGASASELDKLAEKLVFRMKGAPAFKGYGSSEHPFPATVCASLNDEVVHGIPSEDKILKGGDILKIDIGMKFEEMFTDMARTFPIGKISSQAKKLIAVTESSFWEGAKKLMPGEFLSGYSKAVQKYVEKNGFSVVRNLVGHGIGRELHEDPQIPNYYSRKYQDIRLAPNMALALEPMVNAGGFETMLAHDGWTFKTRDGSLSAHYENTVLITESGVEVITVI